MPTTTRRGARAAAGVTEDALFGGTLRFRQPATGYRVNVDAILLAPKTETGWDAVLRDVAKAGIPVVLVDRGVQVDDPSLYATLIASDFGRRSAGKNT